MMGRSWARAWMVGALAWVLGGCSPFGARDARTARTEPEAVVEELGSRLHPKARLIQLEATWLALNFGGRTSELARVPSDDAALLRRLCAHNLRAAELLFERYAATPPRLTAHAIESMWRFESPRYAPCRKDEALGPKLTAYLERAEASLGDDVAFPERDWSAATEGPFVFVEGRFHGMHEGAGDGAVATFNGQDVVGRTTSFEGFEVRERFGRYSVEEKNVTRNVVQSRDDAWVVVELAWKPKRFVDASASGLVLLEPKGTQEREGGGEALSGTAVAVGRRGVTDWEWVSWSTRRLPPDHPMLRLGDDVAEPVVAAERDDEDDDGDETAATRGAAAEATSKPTAPVPAPTPTRHAEAGGISSWVWVGLGVTLAGLTTGVVAGSVATARAAELRAACAGESQCHGAITDAQLDEAMTIAHVSTVGFVATGVGAAVGVVGLVLSDWGSTEERAYVPKLRVGLGRATVEGSF